jgi:UDP-N-acetylglucosamine 1-carboxyvinyltransferase
MSARLFITGGRQLNGEVTVSGAKNVATKMLIASLLTDEPVILHNIPRLGDVEITAEICETVGAKLEFEGNTVRIHTPKITETTIGKLSRTNRIGVLALSPLLHRQGKASVPVVGGDDIGPRPVNFHLEALRLMGATISETDSGYHAEAKGLHGAVIDLAYPSVGATENIIFAAVLAKGRTIITNAAIEPEIVDIIKMLQQMGAIIEFRANRTIIIDGVPALSGVEYTIMPDRIEAASLGLLGIITDGDVLVKGTRQEDLITLLNTLRRVGASYSVEPTGIRFKRGGTALIGGEFETDTHPGFSTDWQQPLAVLLTQAQGLSVIHETVYEDRFGYTETLRGMGANIGVFSKCLGELPCRFKGKAQKHSAVINGATPLHKAKIVIPDIRAGMAHVLAALIATGESELTGVEHLMRGYDDLLGKLESVGAEFTLR